MGPPTRTRQKGTTNPPPTARMPTLSSAAHADAIQGGTDLGDQQAQRDDIGHKDHAQSGTQNDDRSLLPRQEGHGDHPCAAEQERRVGQIAAQPAGVLPARLRAGAEQDPLVGRRAEGRQPARRPRPAGESTPRPWTRPAAGRAERLDRHDQGQRQRVDGQAPGPQRHGRAGLEHPEHVVETQRVAQVEHQAAAGRRARRTRATGYAALRRGGEDRRRRPVARRRDQEQPGRQVVEQQVPGDEPVPVGRLGHRAGRVAGAVVCGSGVGLASQRPRRNRTPAGGDRGQPASDGADVIALHVQPRIERLLRQAIRRGPIDQEVERIQLGIGLAGGVAVEVGAGDAPRGAAPPRACGACSRSSSIGPNWIDCRRAGLGAGRRPGRRAGGRSRACTCAHGRRSWLRVMTPNGQAAMQ